MSSLQKSTIVRAKNGALRAFFRYGEHVAPAVTAKAAKDLWFTAPPRMAQLPLPDGGETFEVTAQGHPVRGMVWSPGSEPVDAQPPRPVWKRRRKAAPVVYLVHGWGGRGSQFGALVEPLVEAGFRVVMFDAPGHGDSDPGPAGPRLTNGVDFAKALDAVFCRFGPAEAVVAHSMGTISTYLAIRFGWVGTGRLAFVAPMVEFASLLEQFQQALGFGRRTRNALDREIDRFVGIPVLEFDARIQAAQVDPLPTLVITDRDDRQTPHAEVVDFAESIGAPLITTEGLGHRKVLRDPDVVRQVVDFLTGGVVEGTVAAETAAS